MKLIDLVGKVFGRLTVTGLAGRTAKRECLWACVCECGQKTTVRGGRLRRGDTRSCGCLCNELSSRRITARARPADEAAVRRVRCAYKTSARKRGLKITLTLEELRVLVLGNCVYCGHPPSRAVTIKGRKKVPQSDLKFNGIDRVDNNKGYIPDNCVTCCEPCNRGKNDTEQKEWLEYLESMTTYRLRLREAQYAA